MSEIKVVTPEKSPGDDRSYRLLVLPNKLKVLLIHDETTDMASAGLDVHVGHFSDPDEAPGLAHFLEHMLFLGTEKYPTENAYQKYLNDHGGNSNAYTDMEHTNYFFDVTHDHLEGALDRFAQFFIAPLFTASATDREMNAVHNENSKNLLNDTWRMFQLCKSTANPAHPFSKFGTGNLTTLRDSPQEQGTNVMELLRQFHNRYYSANLMSLSILGRESLDTLQQWITDKFSSVVNNNVERPVFAQDAFVASSFNRYKIVPIKDLKKLTLMWSAEPVLSLYKSKPWNVISHLLGHEGAGSVLSLLKAKGWANSLGSGIQQSCTCFSAFTCSMDLTEEGLSHIDEIVEIVYQYINCMKTGDEKTWTALFQEVKLITDSNFRFKSKSAPMSAVRTHANSLHLYANEDVLTGPSLFVDFDYKEIQRFISYLYPSNMRIHVVSQQFAGSTDSKEKWYNTDYISEPLDEKFINTLSNVSETKALHLPKPNPFIPSDFKLKFEASDDDRKTPPTQIATLSNDGISVWWKPDKTFKMPKASIKTRIISPAANVSPTSAVLTALYTNLLEDSLVEFAYDAEVAGLVYSVNSTSLGLSVTLRGYNHKLQVLAEVIFERMKTLVVKPERFAVMKEKLARAYRNFDMEQPYQHAAYTQKIGVQEVAWHVNEKLAVMGDVTVEALLQHITRLLRSLDVEMLFHGNMTKAEALALATGLKTQLSYLPIPASQIPSSRVVQLAPGHEYYSRSRVRNPQDANSAVCNAFQIGQFTPANEAKLELLAHIVNEPFFNQLRTKEQLGYLVHSGATLTDGVLFWRLILQSGDYNADYLNARTEAFIYYYGKKLSDMDKKTYDANCSAIIARQLEKDKTLYIETRRLWQELFINRRHFNRADLIVAEVKKTSLADVVSFWNDHILSASNRKKVSTRFFGAQHDFVGNDSKTNQGTKQKQAETGEGKTDTETTATSDEGDHKLPDAPTNTSLVSECVSDRGQFIRKMPLYPQLV